MKDGQKFLKRQPDQFELLIRIYPDDIFLQNHEANLTPDELNAGRNFWKEIWEPGKQPTELFRSRKNRTLAGLVQWLGWPTSSLGRTANQAQQLPKQRPTFCR